MQHSRLIVGDSRVILPTLQDCSIDCCITSPPYFGLRDYGINGQIGLEPTPEAFVAKMVGVFREVRRVLRDDGTLWLNLGDSYNSAASGQNGISGMLEAGKPCAGNGTTAGRRSLLENLKPKDLIGIPWRVAFALQADGWYLRQDIIWHKPNPMPESVTDRCTKAHEYVFLLSKSERYHFDCDAIKEEAKVSSAGIRFGGKKYGDSNDPKHATKSGNVSKEYEKANKRSVWSIATKPFKGAHFATFPTELILPCVRAGCPVGGTVLDPFNGAGTTGLVALNEGRRYVGIELNPAYADMTMQRLGLMSHLVELDNAGPQELCSGTLAP
jgi:DNA modification methylase